MLYADDLVISAETESSVLISLIIRIRLYKNEVYKLTWIRQSNWFQAKTAFWKNHETSMRLLFEGSRCQFNTLKLLKSRVA